MAAYDWVRSENLHVLHGYGAELWYTMRVMYSVDQIRKEQKEMKSENTAMRKRKYAGVDMGALECFQLLGTYFLFR